MTHDLPPETPSKGPVRDPRWSYSKAYRSSASYQALPRTTDDGRSYWLVRRIKHDGYPDIPLLKVREELKARALVDWLVQRDEAMLWALDCLTREHTEPLKNLLIAAKSAVGIDP